MTLEKLETRQLPQVIAEDQPDCRQGVIKHAPHGSGQVVALKRSLVIGRNRGGMNNDGESEVVSLVEQGHVFFGVEIPSPGVGRDTDPLETEVFGAALDFIERPVVKGGNMDQAPGPFRVSALNLRHSVIDHPGHLHGAEFLNAADGAHGNVHALGVHVGDLFVHVGHQDGVGRQELDPVPPKRDSLTLFPVVTSLGR